MTETKYWAIIFVILLFDHAIEIIIGSILERFVCMFLYV